MNIAAAGISALLGSAFLAVGVIIPYYPSFFGLGDSMQSMLSTEQSKARAAVYKLLIDPNSAKFYAVHEVTIDTARYVCGSVESKDREGSYAGQRAFVYEDRTDSAAIDDAGLISRPHARYKPCPVPEEVKPGPLVIDLGGANKIAKFVPKLGAGETMEQSLTRLGSSNAGLNSGQPFTSAGSAPAKSTSPSATVADEKEWRSDQAPGAWPKFAADDPLSKPGPKLTNSEAIEFASEIESRWKRFETGKSTTHPSASEIEEALRALLAIKQQSPEFPQAWASFVALRRIHRTATTLADRR